MNCGKDLDQYFTDVYFLQIPVNLSIILPKTPLRNGPEP